MKALQFVYKGYAKGFKSVNISYVVLRGSTLNFALKVVDSIGKELEFDIQTRFDSLREEYMYFRNSCKLPLPVAPAITSR